MLFFFWLPDCLSPSGDRVWGSFFLTTVWSGVSPMGADRWIHGSAPILDWNWSLVSRFCYFLRESFQPRLDWMWLGRNYDCPGDNVSVIGIRVANSRSREQQLRILQMMPKFAARESHVSPTSSAEGCGKRFQGEGNIIALGR